MITPHAVLQSYLDDLAEIVMRQDWPGYRARVCLPFQLVTHTANLTITTDEDLRLGFDRFAETLRIQRITDLVRLVEGAEQLDEALITGRYVTHMLAGANRVLPPFRSQMTLRLDAGAWRAASITNALANSRWPILIPQIAEPGAPKGTDA